MENERPTLFDILSSVVIAVFAGVAIVVNLITRPEDLTTFQAWQNIGLVGALGATMAYWLESALKKSTARWPNEDEKETVDGNR